MEPHQAPGQRPRGGHLTVERTYDTVEDWLAAHGGPRRFEMGASNHPDAIKAYLVAKGYELRGPGLHVGRKIELRQAGTRGRGRMLTVRQIMTLVDELRAAEGLEPLALPGVTK